MTGFNKTFNYMFVQTAWLFSVNQMTKFMIYVSSRRNQFMFNISGKIFIFIITQCLIKTRRDIYRIFRYN